jgi:general secretion pathway protein C
MQETTTQRGWLHFVTFVTAAASAASAVFWLLGGATGSASIANPSDFQSTPAASSVPNALSLAQSLGASSSAPSAETAPSQASRLRLLGVVAGSSDDKPGFALVSVDGGSPKTYAVGAKVADAWVLQSVQRRSATLGADAKGPALVTLELPKTNLP